MKENYYENIENQSIDHGTDINIVGTNIKFTNLRIITDSLPSYEMNNTLNQWIVKDAERLLLADNADKNIYTDNYTNKNWI